LGPSWDQRAGEENSILAWEEYFILLKLDSSELTLCGRMIPEDLSDWVFI